MGVIQILELPKYVFHVPELVHKGDNNDSFGNKINIKYVCEGACIKKQERSYQLSRYMTLGFI
jgi:hypothetical protein